MQNFDAFRNLNDSGASNLRVQASWNVPRADVVKDTQLVANADTTGVKWPIPAFIITHDMPEIVTHIIGSFACALYQLRSRRSRADVLPWSGHAQVALRSSLAGSAHFVLVTLSSLLMI
jgi:hypothetical protein